MNDQEPAAPEFTTQDIQLATLSLLIALAERLTGCEVTVYVRNAAGKELALGGNPRTVTLRAAPARAG